MSDLYTEFTEHLTPLPGEDNKIVLTGITCRKRNMKGGNNMGYSNKAKAADANADKVNDKNFITINDITIDRANEIKDGVVMFDMTVGHIKIYGMSMRHMTNKDGQEWDAISFPARKADNGKYYDIAWFPMSAELKAQVAEKVIGKLNA